MGERFGEPSEHVLEYEGELLSGPDLTQVIGTITLRIADLEYADEADCPAFEVLDSLDEALAHFCALVNPKTGEFRPVVRRVASAALCRMLIIDRVEIESKYRGRGLGLKAMDIACKRLGTTCRLAVLKAFPIQWEGRVNEGPKAFAQDRSKLIEYYRRAGSHPWSVAA